MWLTAQGGIFPSLLVKNFCKGKISSKFRVHHPYLIFILCIPYLTLNHGRWKTLRKNMSNCQSKMTNLLSFLSFIPTCNFHIPYSFVHRMTDKEKKYVVVEFEDGVRIVPITWLSTDLQRSKWPKKYTTNKRYDRAIKTMEEPDDTWDEHRVIKIYATCSDYTTVREKLKWSERLLDINSCTDEADVYKKSRKFRAAKEHKLSFYDYSDDEDGDSDEEVILNPPKPSICKQTNICKETAKKNTHTYKDTKNVKNFDTFGTKSANIASCSTYYVEEDNFQTLQRSAILNVKSHEKNVRRSPTNLDLNTNRVSQYSALLKSRDENVRRSLTKIVTKIL
ncbi:uncharacterized protein LOC113005933 [Solenopsis invicta]|uniref:uncharacterized protein LOC113005933 n=1 Tax=Solenopsis invicta TaxID=13686 RepID=UPI00193E7044|nr:uncharacterized protein LOC113005933 [Solenopsis invicta]